MTHVYFDHETFLICPGVQAPPVVCTQFALDAGPIEIVGAWDPAWRRLWTDWLASSATFSGYNSRFDFACLAATDPDYFLPLVFQAYKAGRVTCTQNREILLRIARGDAREVRDLGTTLSDRKLRTVDKTDPWRLKYGTLWRVPVDRWPADAVHYAQEDVRAERDLFLSQSAEASARGANGDLLNDQGRQAFAGFWLYLTQCWGVRTDQKRVEEYHAFVMDGLERDKRLLLSAGLVRPDGSKDTKLAKARLEATYKAVGRDVPLTATKQTSLDEEACKGSQDPVLEAYSRFAQANTLRGKVERLRKPLIQASYNTIVATGRTSCRQGKDPKPGQPPTSWGSQMQNPPRAKGVRECFVPRAGHAIVSCDYETFELRTYAQANWWRFKFSPSRDILNDAARDMHVEMGAHLTDRSLDAGYALKGQDKAAFKDMRNMAKGPNFGLPGGMGWERLIDYCYDSYGVTITPDLSHKAVAIWKSNPENVMHLDVARRSACRVIGKRTNGEPIMGGDFKCFLSNRVRGSIPYTELANSPFQSLAADAAKYAGCRLAEACYVRGVNPILYGCRILAFVHDEFLAEVPLEGLHERAFEWVRLQIEAAQEWVPDVTIRAEPAAMLSWSKSAGDPVYKNGKLIPYEWRDEK